MENSSFTLFLCWILPIVLFAFVLAVLFLLFRLGRRGMKQIVVADDFTFFEDSEGRLHRKGKRFRNMAAYVVFVALAIGSMICVVTSAMERNWGYTFLSIFALVIPACMLWYLWNLRKIPKLIFDTPAHTVILRASGQEERLPFENIERFDVGYRPMTDENGGILPNQVLNIKENLID
jgi:hypothetical protein